METYWAGTITITWLPVVRNRTEFGMERARECDAGQEEIISRHLAVAANYPRKMDGKLQCGKSKWWSEQFYSASWRNTADADGRHGRVSQCQVTVLLCNKEQGRRWLRCWLLSSTMNGCWGISTLEGQVFSMAVNQSRPGAWRLACRTTFIIYHSSKIYLLLRKMRNDFVYVHSWFIFAGCYLSTPTELNSIHPTFYIESAAFRAVVRERKAKREKQRLFACPVLVYITQYK